MYGVVLFALLAVVVAGENDYSNKFDNIDVDAILSNDRLLNNYISCFLDKGHCTPEGEEVKKTIPDALQSDCSKCSEKHKNEIKKIVKFMMENKKAQFADLEAKFDPEGTYRQKYKERAAAEGIKI